MWPRSLRDFQIPQLPSSLHNEQSKHHDQPFEGAPQSPGHGTAMFHKDPAAVNTNKDQKIEGPDPETSQQCPHELSNPGGVPATSDVTLGTLDYVNRGDAEGGQELKPELCEDRLQQLGDKPDGICGSLQCTRQTGWGVEDATFRILSWKVLGKLLSHGLAASTCRRGLLYRCVPPLSRRPRD